MIYAEKEVVNTVEEFIRGIMKDRNNMKDEYSLKLWFRGQPVDKPLSPKIYRDEYKRFNENSLVQEFRMKAQGLGKTPMYERIDEWLFLMQHSGLPTRLLDWTEGALIALFFAINNLHKVDEPSPVVWMLSPLILNANINSYGQPKLPLSWVGGTYNACPKNIRGAFEKDQVGNEFPIALMPQYIHVRVSVQKSCFMVHGKRKESIEELYRDNMLIKDGYLKKYYINEEEAEKILDELRILSITYFTMFPDFDGLAKELSAGIELNPSEL